MSVHVLWFSFIGILKFTANLEACLLSSSVLPTKQEKNIPFHRQNIWRWQICFWICCKFENANKWTLKHMRTHLSFAIFSKTFFGVSTIIKYFTHKTGTKYPILQVKYLTMINALLNARWDSEYWQIKINSHMDTFAFIWYFKIMFCTCIIVVWHQAHGNSLRA